MNTYNKKLIILCIEGCHGSGKTKLCEVLRSNGYKVFDEGFMSHKDENMHFPSTPPCITNVHPQSILMESMWVTQWFKRVLHIKQYMQDKHKKIHTNEKHCDETSNKKEFTSAPPPNLPKDIDICFVDRSPYSAVFYTKNNKGYSLKPMIEECIKQLERDENIFIRTMCLDVDREILWDRIQKRLDKEPFRIEYNEHKYEWMEQIYNLYHNFPEWNLNVKNNNMKECTDFPSILLDLLRTEEKRKKLKLYLESTPEALYHVEKTDTK